ncbi:MAG: response regulator transcription factor [Proteobacteria bacterium]|nr:response regulator transcription factor [Pseudomonadota bacterium]
MTGYKIPSALILDDHAIIRQTCRELIERENMTIAWEGEDGEEAYKNYILLKPDIAVIDLSIKGLNGLEIIRLIRNHDKNAKIIVFSMHTDSIFISRALDLGVLCYISKTSAPDEFISAIRFALNGKTYVSKELNFNLNTSRKTNNTSNVLSLLTPQQRKIFQLIVTGESTTAIGKKLKISTKSVSTHLKNIKEKLGANTISDIVRMAIILDSLDKK